MDSKVLKPSETEESFGYLFWLQLKNEENEAKKAVESVVSTMELADQALQKARCASPSRQSLSRIEQKLSIARSKLAAVTTSLNQISRWRKLIKEFKSQTKEYSIARGDVAHQSKLLQ